MLKTKYLPAWVIILVFGGFILIQVFSYPRPAYAYQVDPLPSDNLITNPWFRSSADPNQPGFDSWVNVNNYWTLSQKESNPSPNLLVAGPCGTTPDFCGTAAKLAADDGNAQVGVDSYLEQVVAANPNNPKLKFFARWVAHYVDPFQVNIFGGPSQNGPWTFVWQPIDESVLTLVIPPPGEGQDWLWEEFTSRTPMTETTLSQGFPYYKVQILANLPQPDGFKLTGVYFTAATGSPNPATPTTSPTPLPTPTTPTPPPPDFTIRIFMPVVSYLAGGPSNARIPKPDIN